ncbi:hypothetical protein [Pseudoalteromonas sp. B160]|uniref:hypothetical protein n=1 Tax=Pseudoalteromonas sp. B160 TaxID=630414 RepID=UPI00301C6917
MKIQLLVLLPLLVSAFVSGLVKANDEVLSVDQVALQGMQFSFENDAKITPKKVILQWLIPFL